MPQISSIISLTITKIGHEGDGLGEYLGRNVIVAKTAIGDEISCVITHINGDRIHAQLQEILKPGAVRVAAPCQYYNNCGGCSLQHISANAYKDFKLGLLTNALNQYNIPLPAQINWFTVGEHSRRRAFLQFDKSGKLGFFKQQSHDVINIKQCLILEEALELQLFKLQQLSSQLPLDITGWMLTNTANGLDIIMHSGDKISKNDSKIFTTLAGFVKQTNQDTKHKIARLAWQRGKKLLPVITVTQPILQFGGRNITLPEEYFLQASQAGQTAILNALLPWVAEGAKLLDIYSGIGVYSFALADKASQISAYEIAPKMIDAMERNINDHKLGNKISAYCRDIDSFPLGREELFKFDTAIINPPRAGAAKQVALLGAAKLQKIIMVSCNSHTFASDAKILHQLGYKLSQLSVIDQFYYSNHLEQVGLWKQEDYSLHNTIWSSTIA